MIQRFWLATILSMAMTGCQAELTAATRSADGQSLTQSIRYFDGRHWRDAWVSDREVVEFVTGQTESQVRSVSPGASVVKQSTQMRIWRLEDLQEPLAVSRSLSLSEKPSGNRYSPVFHATARGGSRMALGGSIVIRFKPDWSESQIASWLQNKGLTQARKLQGLPRTYVITAQGTGLAVIEEANALHESGELEYAMPEWWRETVKR